MSDEYRVSKRPPDVEAEMDAMRKRCGANEACSGPAGSRIIHAAMQSGKVPLVSWERIVDHIDHAVKIAGVDHVGLGSDFDGATMPIGMEDASSFMRKE